MKQIRVYGGKFYVADGDTMKLAHPSIPIPVTGGILDVDETSIVDRWSIACRRYWDKQVRMKIIDKPPVIIKVGDSQVPWGGQLNITPREI